MKEYERMKDQIKTLNAKNVENFITREYSDVLKNEYHLEVNTQGIIGALNTEQAEALLKELRDTRQHRTLV